jgi:hypothetical protein
MKYDAIFRPRELKSSGRIDLTAICVDVCQQADDDDDDNNVTKPRSLKVRETFELNQLKSTPSQLLPVFSRFKRLQTCCH